MIKKFKKMKKAIIGFGGHAREVKAQINQNVTFFVDDCYVTEGTNPLSEFDPYEYEAIIAISDPKIRQSIVDKLPTQTKFFTFIHSTCLILDKNIEIGAGSFIGAYSILTTNIFLGKHSILNRGCQIGHDSYLDDFSTLMPGVIISGNCRFGKGCYFGTNSSVREKITICDDVTIGLNAGVVKNIIETGTYVGVPAKKIK
jgi:sugar O-acyltransferase (sialic acid O-acetyltransferase NeuD family)